MTFCENTQAGPSRRRLPESSGSRAGASQVKRRRLSAKGHSESSRPEDSSEDDIIQVIHPDHLESRSGSEELNESGRYPQIYRARPAC